MTVSGTGIESGDSNQRMNHPFIDNILSSLSTPRCQWDAEQEVALLAPLTYIESSPGKASCTKIMEAFDHWIQVHPTQLETISRIAEQIHDATLLLDDIEDDSELRRGKPAAHKIYGIPKTINSANYVYFLAYQEILKIPYESQYILNVDPPHRNASNSFRFVQIFNDEMLAMHRGQGLDIFWRDSFRCPTEEEYIQMVKGKSGGLLRIAVRLMMECSANTDIDYVPLADVLAIWYQIRDDYMNLQSDTYTKTKGFAEDLEEGKFSFLVIHGIHAKPDSKYLLDILRQRPKSSSIKSQAISYLKEVTHSFEYTRSVLASLEAQARAETTRLGGNPKLEAFLERMKILERD